MKAWDLPIKGNPLCSREDLVESLDQLLLPLLGRFERGGAGLHLGNSSAHYDELAALLEGESRLLWGLAPLVAGAGDQGLARPAGNVLATILRGLKAGSDPDSPNYWGQGGNRDQRFVEMAALALSLLLAPQTFWEPLSRQEKDQFAAWLGTINGVELPPTNWEFFRVLVNLALKTLGEPYSPQALESSLAAVEALYRLDGWYIDETNYDLYNPFAFHFYGLVYAVFAGKEDPGRATLFRERARRFAQDFLPWFGSDGTAVPFGRSLTYRFAAVAFFSACAFAGEAILPWGQLKGIILRNLRSWFAKPIFDHEGVLSIGYDYPDLLMAEQYNAPGSPYWALKTYLVLALPPSHPFWTSPEEGLPALPPTSLNRAPGLLITRTGSGLGEHVYFLNAGQYPGYECENAAAKYAKFAYSNRFGFCVSHASWDLSKTGCDSSLLLSEGDGYWRERRQSQDRLATMDFVASTWKPWPGVEIRTWLVPLGPWHLRVHRIDSDRSLKTVEGGFSLPDSNSFGPIAKPLISHPKEGSLLAILGPAIGAIVDLSGGRVPELHKPEPNLNILFPRVLVPILRGNLSPGRTILATAVYADPFKKEVDLMIMPELSFSTDRSTCTISFNGRSIDLDLSDSRRQA